MVAITDPSMAASSNPAEAAAAGAKADEDAAPQKIKAIRYLATLGCAGCYPGIEDALLESLDDCTEEVRWEAAKAIRELSGKPCSSVQDQKLLQPESAQEARRSGEQDGEGMLQGIRRPACAARRGWRWPAAAAPLRNRPAGRKKGHLKGRPPRAKPQSPTAASGEQVGLASSGQAGSDADADGVLRPSPLARAETAPSRLAVRSPRIAIAVAGKPNRSSSARHRPPNRRGTAGTPTPAEPRKGNPAASAGHTPDRPSRDRVGDPQFRGGAGRSERRTHLRERGDARGRSATGQSGGHALGRRQAAAAAGLHSPRTCST